jgi:hypothetical protein
MEAERMVGTDLMRSFAPPARLERRSPHYALATLSTGLLFLCTGCALAPRSQMEECQQLSRTLRSENARLKDRLLVLQSQNRDYADRALDDSRQLASQQDAIERLEGSVQAYQDERSRLESAYNQLASSLGAAGSRNDDQVSNAARPATPGKQPRAQSTTTDSRDAGDKARVR